MGRKKSGVLVSLRSLASPAFLCLVGGSTHFETKSEGLSLLRPNDASSPLKPLISCSNHLTDFPGLKLIRSKICYGMLLCLRAGFYQLLHHFFLLRVMS